MPESLGRWIVLLHEGNSFFSRMLPMPSWQGGKRPRPACWRSCGPCFYHGRQLVRESKPRSTDWFLKWGSSLIRLMRSVSGISPFWTMTFFSWVIYRLYPTESDWLPKHVDYVKILVLPFNASCSQIVHVNLAVCLPSWTIVFDRQREDRENLFEKTRVPPIAGWDVLPRLHIVQISRDYALFQMTYNLSERLSSGW